jgi:hypothetical protein
VPSVTQQNVEYMLYICASRLSNLQVPNEFQTILTKELNKTRNIIILK